MLHDARLKTLFSQIVPGVPLPAEPDDAESQVQPASIDLTMGNIYLPGVDRDELGGWATPRGEHSLLQGQTAVITTRETVKIPREFAAIGFPPTRLSNNGILMTNPGHVDPGYQGKLSFTVINMGRAPYELRKGDRVVTLVVFELTGVPDRDYAMRNPALVGHSEVTAERLERLAPDMLNVDERINIAVSSEEHKTRRFSIWVPLALAAVVAVGTIFGPLVNERLSGVGQLENRIELLEREEDVDDLERRLDELERAVGNR